MYKRLVEINSYFCIRDGKTGLYLCHLCLELGCFLLSLANQKTELLYVLYNHLCFVSVSTCAGT